LRIIIFYIKILNELRIIMHGSRKWT